MANEHATNLRSIAADLEDEGLDLSADYVNDAAAELDRLTATLAERDALLNGSTLNAHQRSYLRVCIDRDSIRTERDALRAAIAWVRHDARYKAPEQVDPEIVQRWLDRLEGAALAQGGGD